ncbi:uncharacterized protein ISCGN_003174 [Ixodes scapularis]
MARHRRQMKMAATRARTASQYYGSSFCACTSDSLSRPQVFLLRYQRARSLAEIPQEPQKTDARSTGNHLPTEGEFTTCCIIVCSEVVHSPSPAHCGRDGAAPPGRRVWDFPSWSPLVGGGRWSFWCFRLHDRLTAPAAGQLVPRHLGPAASARCL